MATSTEEYDIIVNTKHVVEGDKEAQDSIKSVGKLGSDNVKMFGLQNTALGRMISSVTEFGGKAKTVFTSVKTLVAGTGIGLLLILIAGLVNYFKKTEEGAGKLKEIMGALAAVVRDGPILVFKSLKVVFSAIKLGVEEIILVWYKLKGVFDKSAEMKAQISSLKDEIDDTKKSLQENAKGFVDSAKAMVDHAKTGADIAKREQELHIKQREDLKEQQKLENDIADLREKAAEENVTAAQKQDLYNQSIAKENELFKLKKADAAEELSIIQDKIKNGDKSTEILDEQAAKELEIMKLEEEHSKTLKTLNKATVTAQKQDAAEKAKVLDEEKKAKDKALEDDKKRADEQAKLAEEQKKKDDKKLEDIKKLQDDILLLHEDGQLKEATQQQIAYETELAAIGDNLEAKNLLWEKYQLLAQDLKKKYDDQAAADKKTRDAKELADTKTLEEGKKAIQQQGVQDLTSIGQALQGLAGKNKGLALAGLFIEKAVAIGQIVSSTAIATSKAIAASPLTFGLPWSAINIAAGVLGVANVIKQAADSANQINSAKIPKYASGTNFHPGGDMIVGEKGIERITAPPGTQVFSNTETMSQLSQFVTRDEMLQYFQLHDAIPVIIDENGSYKSLQMGKKVEVQLSRYSK
jgi:hypothetical protein